MTGSMSDDVKPADARPDRLRPALRIAWQVVRFVAERLGSGVYALTMWQVRHPKTATAGVLFAAITWGLLTASSWPGSRTAWLVGIVLASQVGALFDAAFALLAPSAYRRYEARGTVRRRWHKVAVACGLGQLMTAKAWNPWRGGWHIKPKTVTARLVSVKANDGGVILRVRVLDGHTIEDNLARAASSIATAFKAHSHRLVPAAPGVADLHLFMVAKIPARTAAMPTQVHTSAVPAARGRDEQIGSLQIAGRHTLVVGATGAGKGSALWGVAGNFAPAVHEGSVRLWGVDLKKGLELEMGRPLFGRVAYQADDAVALLRELLTLMDQRGQAMRGVSRQHVATPGDPLHVLIVDELADLMAYSDYDIRRVAEQIMAKVLTQGRALGFAVVSCGQNPRQEAVAQRNLYNQKVALRLDSETETEMMFGPKWREAPAHTIDPAQPGLAYLVPEDGAPELVRFDYWPDGLIRETAAQYPAPAYADTPAPAPVADAASAWLAAGGNLAAIPTEDDGASSADLDAAGPATSARPPRKRSPRKNPRNRRTAESGPGKTDTTVAETAMEGEAS